MKTIRLKNHPYSYVKPINRSGTIVIERAEEPMKIPDHITENTLKTIWGDKYSDDDFELIALHQ